MVPKCRVKILRNRHLSFDLKEYLVISQASIQVEESSITLDRIHSVRSPVSGISSARNIQHLTCVTEHCESN